jgi:hypothetical protein
MVRMNEAKESVAGEEMEPKTLRMRRMKRQRR